jgi:hypothetical protein
MRKLLVAVAGITAALVAGFAIYWRWFPRAGLRWTNERFNPWLVEHGWSGAGRSEIGTLEHFGRQTGTRHLTPIHPVPTAEGFRVVVPLGDKSQWARNVLAAGHCRIQLRDVVHELDEPVLVRAVDVRELPRPVRWAEERLGFRYLLLHRFAEHAGELEPAAEAEPRARKPVADAEPMRQAATQRAIVPEAASAGKRRPASTEETPVG